MIRGAIIWVMLLVSQIVWAQHQDPVLVQGQVLDAHNKTPLHGAHLVVNNTFGTTPDIEGNFTLQLSAGDTLMVSHVGYVDYLVPIPQNLNQNHYFLRIALSPATVELDEVTIYQWPATVEQFKQELLALEVEEEEKVIIPGSYQGPPRPVEARASSPVSFLYEKFSRRAKQRKAFQKKRLDIETHQKARARWNSDYVKEITGIEDEQTLVSFMEYCRLNDQKLGELNDYDLIAAINQCYQDFKEQL